MNRLIKIIILGDTGSGKTILTKHLAPKLKEYGDFNVVAIDNHRKNIKNLEQEINAKYVFARNATNSFKSSIIECSGVGLTSTVLLNALKNFAQINPDAIIQAFFLKPPGNNTGNTNKYHPEEAVEYFLDYNPVLIKSDIVSEKVRIIQDTIKKKAEH